MATLPSPEQTLRSYVETWSTGPTVDELFVALGVDPTLATRVDERVQVLPIDVAERLAAWLGRPVAEVIWAAGGRTLTALAPGVNRRTY